MKIPKRYLPIMPYLIVNDGKAFVKFMKTVFGATEHALVPRDEQTIMHGELRIHDAVVMFADATEQWKERPAGMFIYVESADKTFEAAIRNGATVLREPTDQEYGRNAGFQDSFGNQWWVVEAPKM